MRCVFAGESVVYEFRSTTLKGRTCWMETHAVPLRDARGEVHAYAGITRDTTEHKWAEECGRRHQTELARVARLSTMGEMATGLAHELNQPLAAIANARHCIRRLVLGGLHRTAGGVRAGGARGEIMRHVRDFVRKSEPRMTAWSTSTRSRVVKFHRTRGAPARNGCHASAGPATAPRVRADSIMIEQVVCNLVRNAVEAMAETRSQRRETDPHCTARRRHRGGRRYRPGIDETVIDNVFDQFFTTKTPGVTWGCPSAADRRRTAAHPRRVAAGGATFRFTLQAIPVAEPRCRRQPS